MHPLMLCIHMEKEKALRLAFLGMSLGVAVKPVEADQEGQTLGALCGLESLKEKTPAVQAGEEMLVFAFLPDDMLDKLLPALRSSGLGVRLKAMLTPTNRDWNCAQLYRELSSEAAAMEKRK